MASMVQFTGVLVPETCCVCGVVFGLPEDMQRQRRNDHGSFSCPNGHRQHYTAQNEAEKLRDELAREKHRREQVQASLDHVHGAMTWDRRQATERAKRWTSNRAVLGAFWKGFDHRNCGGCVDDCPYKRWQFRRAWYEGYDAPDPKL